MDISLFSTLLEAKQDIFAIISLSFIVSSMAIFIGLIIGLPLGVGIGIFSFPGRRLCVALIYTMMGFPTVLIGLIVYMVLSRHGWLGELNLLFTPEAMIIAQSMLTTPIIMGLTFSAVYAKSQYIHDTTVSLGATRWQLMYTVLREARKGIWVGVATAFGRAISEVGAVILVGGNIVGSTRVLTTAIILETRKGHFDIALLLGFVLLLISFTVQLFFMFGMMDVFRSKGK